MNDKNSFSEKKLTKKGLLEFLNKKGFYIALIICIAIVGGTAVLLTMNKPSSVDEYNAQKILPEDIASDFNEDANKPDASTSAQSSLSSPQDPEDGKPATNTVNTEVKPTPSARPEDRQSQASGAATPTPVKKQTSKGTDTGSAPKFVMPVFGEITFEYSKDKLVYSKTLEEWRTHSGLDLAAQRGTPVKVVADGVISEIKNDPRFGITVLVDHQNGVKTIYANLASDEVVTPNQKVKQGDVIGSVGSTACFEAMEESHLHFEVLKNDKPVNPEAYLPERKGNGDD